MSWIVIGFSGPESWPVGSAGCEYRAKTHAELANRWAQEHSCVHSRPLLLPPNPWDADMRVYRTGVVYVAHKISDWKGR